MSTRFPVSRRIRSVAGLVVLAAAILVGLAASAHAQSARTWVSGLGDDANPCSRTAPCKTVGGTIAKTAAGGEIDVLDAAALNSSGGLVTITKAISIVNIGRPAGAIVPTAVNAIVVSAGATDVVVLRGLNLDGLGTALNGIRFTSGGALHVEDCAINNFTNAGIDFEPSAQSKLFVSNTVIRNNRTDPTGIGILFKPATTAFGFVDGVRIQRNATGVRVEDGSTVGIRNSTSADNLHDGFSAVSTTNPVQLTIEGSSASANDKGVTSQGAGAVVQISAMTVTSNTTGLATSSGGQIVSFGNNDIRNNAIDGLPTSTIPQR